MQASAIHSTNSIGTRPRPSRNGSSGALAPSVAKPPRRTNSARSTSPIAASTVRISASAATSPSTRGPKPCSR